MVPSPLIRRRFIALGLRCLCTDAAQLRLIPRTAYKKQLWKNGLGYTYEIAVYSSADKSDMAPFSWRLSMADLTPIQEGAFSELPGIDRTILLLSGDCEIRVSGGRAVKLKTHELFRFPGDVPTISTVRANGRDLNCMIDRARYTASVVLVRPDLEVVLAMKLNDTMFIVGIGEAVEGTIDSCGQKRGFELCQEDTLRFECPVSSTTTVRISKGGIAYIAHLSPVEHI